MWKQGLRLNWFRDGDRNIGYFHSEASNRFQKNLIDGLLDQNGCWQELEKEIERIVLDYYSNLFKSLGPRDFSELVEAVELKITHEMNSMLTSEFQQVNSIA